MENSLSLKEKTENIIFLIIIVSSYTHIHLHAIIKIQSRLYRQKITEVTVLGMQQD